MAKVTVNLVPEVGDSVEYVIEGKPMVSRGSDYVEIGHAGEVEGVIENIIAIYRADKVVSITIDE